MSNTANVLNKNTPSGVRIAKNLFIESLRTKKTYIHRLADRKQLVIQMLYVWFVAGPRFTDRQTRYRPAGAPSQQVGTSQLSDRNYPIFLVGAMCK